MPPSLFCEVAPASAFGAVELPGIGGRLRQWRKAAPGIGGRRGRRELNRHIERGGSDSVTVVRAVVVRRVSGGGNREHARSERSGDREGEGRNARREEAGALWVISPAATFAPTPAVKMALPEFTPLSAAFIPAFIAGPPRVILKV